jgi:hypothetical protein
MLTILTTPKGGSRAGAEDSNYSYRKWVPKVFNRNINKVS